MLQNAVENEKQKVKTLNDQIFQLNQKLYEVAATSQMTDSLESGDLNKTLHIKIETTTKNHNFPFRTFQPFQNNDSGVSINSQSEILGLSATEEAPYKVLTKIPPNFNANYFYFTLSNFDLVKYLLVYDRTKDYYLIIMTSFVKYF